MKKSFIVFSLIGIVAIGMSFTSCKNEATSEALNCSYEESWQQLEQQVEQLNVEYEHLATEKIARGGKVMAFDADEIELRSKYKGARSGKLMYKMLRRVFSKNFRKSAQGLSDEQVKEKVVNEMENMTGVMDEQFKAQLMKTQVEDYQTARLHKQYISIQTQFMNLAMDLGVEDLRHYAEEYIEIINTTLTDKDERITLTIQISMAYYICAFWSTEGAHLVG